MKLRQVELSEINKFSENTMSGLLGMECIEVGDNFIRMTMPVDNRTRQGYGLLHGGASIALIESAGSIGSTLLLDLSKEVPVGLEVNANHVKGMRTGSVVALAEIVHIGRKTHIWKVDISDEETGKLVCTGRLTVMIVPKP